MEGNEGQGIDPALVRQQRLDLLRLAEHILSTTKLKHIKDGRYAAEYTAADVVEAAEELEAFIDQ